MQGLGAPHADAPGLPSCHNTHIRCSPWQAGHARLPTCVIVECWVSSFVMRHMNSACSRVPISRANCHPEGKGVAAARMWARA